jgi:hypothetical protein
LVAPLGGEKACDPSKLPDGLDGRGGLERLGAVLQVDKEAGEEGEHVLRRLDHVALCGAALGPLGRAVGRVRTGDEQVTLE